MIMDRLLPFASHDIRRQVRQGRSIRYQVPDAVQRYIRRARALPQAGMKIADRPDHFSSGCLGLVRPLTMGLTWQSPIARSLFCKSRRSEDWSSVRITRTTPAIPIR